jgi:hypothetical protein
MTTAESSRPPIGTEQAELLVRRRLGAGRRKVLVGLGFVGILLGVIAPVYYWSSHMIAVLELSGVAKVSWTRGDPWWTRGSTSVDLSGAFMSPKPPGLSVGTGGNPLEPLTRLRDVESVDLTDGFQIREDQLDILGRLTRLKSLRLGMTQEPWIVKLGPSPRGDVAIGHLSGLIMLEELDLSGSGVTDAGLQKLLPLSRLSTLNLRDTRIGDSAIPALAALGSLRELDLGGTNVTDAGLRALMRQRPEILVQYGTNTAMGANAPDFSGVIKP